MVKRLNKTIKDNTIKINNYENLIQMQDDFKTVFNNIQHHQKTFWVEKRT